jgi:metal transporter CNNM
MAVIVSKLPSSSTEPTIGSSNSSPQPGIPHWTATQSTNARIIYRMKTAESQVDWTSDWAANFLRASQMDIKRPGSLKQNVVGFESPAPIGIITFEDIIDTILQKPSRDERAFFSVNQVLSLKSINGNLIYPACGGHPRVTSGILPSFKDVVQDSLLGSAKEIKKVQRKSSVSGANDIIGGIDGGDMSSARMVNTGNIDDCVHVSKFRRNFVSHQKTDYRKVFTAGMDGVDDRNEHKGMKIIILPRRGSSRGSSSYTEDRQGGFHVSRRIPWNNPKLEISEEREAVTAAIGLNVSPKVSSLPYRRGFSSLLSDGVETLWRNVSATHALPRPGCATTSSNGRLSTFERSAVDVKDSSDLSFPLAPASESLVNTNPQAIYDASGIDIDENNSGGLEEAVDDTHNKSGSAISVSSWNYADLLAAQNGNQHLRATCGLRLASVTFPVISSKKDEPTTVPSNSGVTLSDDRYSQAPEQDYTGFPSELLGTINLSREKSVPDYASKTLPRKVELTANPIDFDNIEPGNAQEVQIGYDDEAPIPIYGSTVKDGIINGARSSSFWL